MMKGASISSTAISLDFTSVSRIYEDKSAVASIGTMIKGKGKSIPKAAWDTSHDTVIMCKYCPDNVPATARHMLKEGEEAKPGANPNTHCDSCADDAETNGEDMNRNPCGQACGNSVVPGKSTCVNCLDNRKCKNFDKCGRSGRFVYGTSSVSKFCEECHLEDRKQRKCSKCGTDGILSKAAICASCERKRTVQAARKSKGIQRNCKRCDKPMWNGDNETYYNHREGLGSATIGCKRDDCYKKCSQFPCNNFRKARDRKGNQYPRCEVCWDRKKPTAR